MKKVFNWLGFLICFVYLIVEIFFAVLSYQMAFSGYTVEQLEYPVTATILLFLLMFFLFPIFWNKTYKFVLPMQQNNAVLINKEQRVLTKYARGLLFTKEIYMLTFQCVDGSRKTFCIESKKNPTLFYSVLYEQGILRFKEQGKHLYFVSFTPDSTGKTLS